MCLPTDPDDYRALVTNLTLRKGADGEQARDAACVGVFIFDDAIPEETESLSFHIRSLNTSVARIMEGCEAMRVFILDNDGEGMGGKCSSYICDHIFVVLLQWLKYLWMIAVIL